VSQGYSLHVRDTNLRAPSTLLGVRLGRACIKHGVSATFIAQQMGVTRQTVYNWFRGAFSPHSSYVLRIEHMIQSLGD